MIHLNKPYIIRQDMDAVLTSLVIEDFENGSAVKALCSRLSELIGRKHVRAFSHGSDAVFQILRNKKQDFSTLVLNPLQSQLYAPMALDLGYEIIWKDCDDNGVTLMDDIPEGAILIPDYPFGIRSEIDRDELVNCFIIEDISRVFGETASSNELFTGDLLVMKTGPDNILTTGQGGVVFSHKSLEMASTMSDINGSLALSQMDNMKENCRRRQQQFARFRDALNHGRHHTVLFEEDDVPLYFPVFVERSTSEIIAYARKQGVETDLFFHIETEGDLADFALHPTATSLMRRVVKFPLYPSLKKNEIEKIARVLMTLP